MATLGGPTRFANIAMATGDFMSLFIELYCPFALQDQQLCALLQTLHEGHKPLSDSTITLTSSYHMPSTSTYYPYASKTTTSVAEDPTSATLEQVTVTETLETPTSSPPLFCMSIPSGQPKGSQPVGVILAHVYAQDDNPYINEIPDSVQASINSWVNNLQPKLPVKYNAQVFLSLYKSKSSVQNFAKH